MRYTVSAAIAFLSLLAPVRCWMNEYDQPVFFQCHMGEFLSYVSSQHDNQYEDRVWDFACRDLPIAGLEIIGLCDWTEFVNDWDQPARFECPREGFIAGIESEHHNYVEDRRFKYKCCEAKGTVTHSCFLTDWENDWEELLNYTVPVGKVMKGMHSEHDNSKEDRRFKFKICDLELRKSEL